MESIIQEAFMLRALNIKQFRGIENLNLGDLGPNNSGKTSILEIIESLQVPSVIYTWGSLAIEIIQERVRCLFTKQWMLCFLLKFMQKET